jgi:hypothetical protein
MQCQGEEMKNIVQVRVLYTNRCPNLEPTIDLIQKIGGDLGLDLEIDKVLVAAREEAEELRCIGSPTVQINGVDIDPGARDSIRFGLG